MLVKGATGIDSTGASYLIIVTVTTAVIASMATVTMQILLDEPEENLSGDMSERWIL